MRENRWCFAHQTGRDHGIRWWRLVKVHVHCGMIVSIEAAIPLGVWDPCDYAAIPDVSGLRVGDEAPEDARNRARHFERFRSKLLAM